jgi:catechol 2,3-dioxygenase-like lactoylglutathione lyase family enzyme
MFQRAAPIFGVHDVDAALAFYGRLGFAVRRYAAAEYGFASREGVEIHLGRPADGERHRTTAYVFVADADAVAAEWRAAGAEVHGPQDTEWGRHEGALVDLDGNVIRFGSPMARQVLEAS